MVLKVFFFFVTFSLAHELVSKDDYDYKRDPHIDELSITQLLRMFYDSNGVVLSLPNGAFTASGTLDKNHAAIYSRIGAPRVEGKAHSWCGTRAYTDEITVDLTVSALVTGVATQGRGDAPRWVTRFSVATSENGHDWLKQGTFVGNFDQETICHSRFKRPVAARFVKLTTLEWEVTNCMRWDVLVAKM